MRVRRASALMGVLLTIVFVRWLCLDVPVNLNHNKFQNVSPDRDGRAVPLQGQHATRATLSVDSTELAASPPAVTPKPTPHARAAQPVRVNVANDSHSESPIAFPAFESCLTTFSDCVTPPHAAQRRILRPFTREDTDIWSKTSAQAEAEVERIRIRITQPGSAVREGPVVVCDDARLIYLRNMKSGSSRVIALLGELFNSKPSERSSDAGVRRSGGTDGLLPMIMINGANADADANSDDDRYRNHDRSGSGHGHGNAARAARAARPASIARNPAAPIAIHRTGGCRSLASTALTEEQMRYFRFTFVRHPIVRLISGFDQIIKHVDSDNFLNEHEQQMEYLKRHTTFFNLPHLHPAVSANNTEHAQSRLLLRDRYRAERLRAFAEDIMNCTALPMLDHLVTQSFAISFTNARGQPLLPDFVGRVEHFDSDFARLLHILRNRAQANATAATGTTSGPGALINLPDRITPDQTARVEPLSNRNSRREGTLKQDVEALRPLLHDHKLCAWFRQDFACFGFPSCDPFQGFGFDNNQSQEATIARTLDVDPWCTA